MYCLNVRPCQDTEVNTTTPSCSQPSFMHPTTSGFAHRWSCATASNRVGGKVQFRVKIFRFTRDKGQAFGRNRDLILTVLAKPARRQFSPACHSPWVGDEMWWSAELTPKEFYSHDLESQHQFQFCVSYCCVWQSVFCHSTGFHLPHPWKLIRSWGPE